MLDKNMCASILLFFIGLVSVAQGGTPPPPLPPPPPPPGLPIDNNIWALILLAIFYGIYKAYQLNKQKT